MASLLLSAFISDIRGKVAGSVFKGSRSGLVICKIPNQPERTRLGQTNQRSRLGFNSRYWSTLTNVQKSTWAAWSAEHPAINKVGEVYTPSGYQSYQKLNLVCQAAGEAINASAPVENMSAGIEALVAADGIATGLVTLTWTDLGTTLATDYVQVQKSRQLASPGSAGEHQEYSTDQYADGNDGTAPIGGVTALTGDAWYWFRARYVGADGQVGNWNYVQWQSPII